MALRVSRMVCALGLALVSSACTSTNLNTALGTPKNPQSTFGKPGSKYRHDQDAYIIAYYNKLAEAFDNSGATPVLKAPAAGYDMRTYVEAGFNLSDIYCNEYFRRADESGRRRRYGRSLTNDAGSLVAGILNFAKAGTDAVTASALAFNVADSAWRGYDDSFAVSPDIANVKSLLKAAQADYRAETLGSKATVPASFAAAHHAIIGYGEICTFTGLKTLVADATKKAEEALKKDAAAKK